MYTVYILKSQKDGRTYVGYSSDFSQRLKYHNSGRVKSTHNRRPLILIKKEEFNSIAEAKNRERWWKSYRGRQVMKNLFK